MSERVIGVGGAIATIVGFVIGVSVFVLPGSLAASAGPAVVVTYFLASLFGLFACVAAAQLGVCYPESGASFIAVADLLGSFWGFLVVWLLVGASAVGIGLLAYGLADYLSSIVAVDRQAVAIGSVLALAFINLSGTRVSTGAQIALVVAFLLALTIFVGAGLTHVDLKNLQPFFANGWSPVLMAVLPAYFSYAGFMVIIELAGEIRRPERTIPLALLISFLLVLITYLLVAFTLVGIIPWAQLAGDASPVSTVARAVLPGQLASAITLTAVAAAASSINGIFLGYSRDVQALAVRGLLPRRALLHAHWMDPSAAGVLPIAIVALLAVALSPMQAAIAAAFCSLGAVLYRMRKRSLV